MLTGDNLVVPVVRGLDRLVVLCRGSGSSTGCGIVAGSSVSDWGGWLAVSTGCSAVEEEAGFDCIIPLCFYGLRENVPILG